MSESYDYDYDVDGDGTWETVSKNKKTKDKTKMNERAVSVKKPGAKGVKPAGAAGTTCRRQNKKANANMPGKKPAPLTNWREAAKKKADTTEMQKRVLLKNVQISRSAKNPPQPVNRQPVNSSAIRIGEGENMSRKSKAAQKTKFDSFQEYNELFPDLPKCDASEEEGAATIQTRPDQDYSKVQPFYDLNGCDVTADILRVLNAAFMADPGNLSTLDQSGLHEFSQIIQPQQEYQVEDELIDNRDYSNESYGGCTGEMDIMNCNVFPTDVHAGGEVRNITQEDLFNIPVDRAEPNIMEVQSTDEQNQELKFNNLPHDVNLHSQSGLQAKSIAEKIVFDEKREYALKGCVHDSMLDTVKENIASTKIKKKRKKRVKVQNKDKDHENMPINVQRQGNTDTQEHCMKKTNEYEQEATTGANNINSDRGNPIEKLPTKVTKVTNLTANIESEITTGVDVCKQTADKDSSGLKSASMDSLASAVSKMNISRSDSNTIFKSDNQNNNCQEAETDDDESCLELTCLESKCDPDYFENLTHVTNQTEQEPTSITADTGQAEDSGMLQGRGEGVCPEATQLLPENTESEDITDSKEVQVDIEGVPPASTDTDMEMTHAEQGGHVQENAEENKDNVENDAVRLCHPCKDTPQTAGPEERQGEGDQGEAQEPIAERKVTYGDVIEYVLEQLKELYAGKEIDRFYPVTRIEHAPLPDELTGHLSLLRQLSYNYTPSWHPYDVEWKGRCDSSESDLSDSFEDSSEEVEEINDKITRPVDKVSEQVPLRRFHKKLQLFAQVNHLHQVVSNPRVAAILEDGKLEDITQQFTNYDGSDLFADLLEGSKPTDESDLRDLICHIKEKESSYDAISTFNHREHNDVPSLSFDYGQVIDAAENDISSHYLDRSGMRPTEREQTKQTSRPKEAECSQSADLILQEEELTGSPEISEVRNGAENSLKSLIASPLRSSDKGLQFFQHSFLSSPENVSDGAFDSRQNHSELSGAVTAQCEQSADLGNIRRFLWSQLTDIRDSLDGEILGLTRVISRQKENKERAWQGGDTMETRRHEEEDTDDINNPTTDVTADVTPHVAIDDEELLDKGWMDRTLVENLVNPKDEEPTEKRNRREYRMRKFGALPFWWMP